MDSFSGQDVGCVRAERLVFRGLSFNLESGGALKLVGPNGSGKSSLLRLMAGLLRPAAGTLAWNGEAVISDMVAHAGRCIYVGHQDAAKPMLTVAENAAFWAGIAGGGAHAEEAVRRGLAAFGIEALATIPCRLLSAGQRRRLALTRLFSSSAPIWLLDEPTVALDRDSVGALERAVAAHREDGGMVALATHIDLSLPDADVLNLGEFTAPREALDEGELV